MPTLQEFYNYIFRNDWADPESGIPSTVKPEAKALQIKARKAKMKALFEDAILPSERKKFRAALRSFGATHLETEMFGNTRDVLEDIYCYSDDYISLFVFWFHRACYYSSYVTQDKGKPNADYEVGLRIFTAFFQVSKIIADFIEHNNTAEDDLVHKHAYWLLTVFGEQDKVDQYFKSIDLYLKKHNFLNTDHPLHDALMWSIPSNNGRVFLPEWRKIIQETGTKAFQLFTRARDIAQQLDSPPQSYLQVLKIARTITFKRSEENPELADLFAHYHLSNESFEKTLAIRQKEKKSDNLPTIVVRGADIHYPRYYLLKLPIGDLRAYVLGHITNCCQSMGGDSENCVIDGVTRANNGFLILVKERFSTSEDKKEDSSTRKVLTESDFDIPTLLSKCKIMGQGYMWVSKLGNITIDSWENLNPEAEDYISAVMLKYYADDIKDLKDSQIARVTIGKGGKTPNQFYDSARFPETMLEGIQYGDSMYQNVICSAVSKNFKTELVKQMKIAFPKMDYKAERILTDAQINYSWLIIKMLKVEVLTNFLKKDDNLLHFTTLLEKHGSNLWYFFALLDDAKLCTQENLAGLFADQSAFVLMDGILQNLKNANLLNQENVAFFFSPHYNKCRALLYATEIRDFLKNLSVLNLLNEETFKIFVTDLALAKEYNQVFKLLREAKFPVDLSIVRFIHKYGTDSAEAIKILSEKFGKPAVDIYQHINANLLPESKSQTIDYRDLLSHQNKIDIDFISDAATTLLVLFGKLKDFDYVKVIVHLTRNGNLPLLNMLINNVPADIKLDLLLFPVKREDKHKVFKYIENNTFKIYQNKLDHLCDSVTTNTRLLLCAIIRGHSDMADYYIKRGANINGALVIAAQDDQLLAFNLLLTEKKASPNSTIAYWSENPNVLDAVVGVGNKQMLLTLLEKKVDIHASPENRYVYEAIRRGHVEVVKLLLESKLQIDRPLREFSPSDLMEAVKLPNAMEMVTMLLDAKADINANPHEPTSSSNGSPLHAAAYHAVDPNVIKLLVERKADINSVNSMGQTPLQHAVWMSHPERLPNLKMLFKLGITGDVTNADDVTRSRLYQASKYSWREEISQFHKNFMKTKTAELASVAKSKSTMFTPPIQSDGTNAATPAPEVKKNKSPDS